MPFGKINVDNEIQSRLDNDPELKELWESSKDEYEICAEKQRQKNLKK